MNPATESFIASGQLSRRSLLLSVPALVTASKVLAQGSATSIPVVGLNHATVSSSNGKQAIEFYQGLFGMPIQARQATTPAMRVGAGPQFLMTGEASNPNPGIHHFCLTTANFDPEKVVSILAGHGIKRDTVGKGLMVSGPGLVFIRMRGEEFGGAKEGTPELSVGDPDGIIVQLQDTTYAGGAGRLGGVMLAKPEPPPTKGLLALEDFSNFHLNVSNVERAKAFYQDIFAMPARQQGSTTLLSVGSKNQFLALTSDGGKPRNTQVGFTMKNFDTDKVQKTLISFGLTPRGDSTNPPRPLVTWITKNGSTPELYFTDPSGLVVQLQDVSYKG
jgi:catechol 2,3-dioxygenase-like lactoylglutathione lyase family enzyme